MDDSIFDPLKAQHRFDEWYNRNSLREDLLVWQFNLSEEDIPGWKLTRIQTVLTPGWPPAIQSVWVSEKAETDALLTVNIYTTESRSEAHIFLIRLLAEFQSQDIFRQEPPAAGDVAFAPPGDAAIVFARANLVTSIQNGGPQIEPVSPVAAYLDEKMKERPQPTERQISPQIKRFTVRAEQAKIGEWQSLDVDAADPLGRAVWYMFFSPTGETRLIEGKPVYTPSAAGEQRLSLYALNPNRAAARQELIFTAEQ